MRILFVIDGLPGGGAEKVVLTLAAQFLRDGDRVSLISLRDVCEYPLPEGLDYQVVADRCRKPWRKLTELSRRARQLDAAVVRAEQQGQFDLVLSNLHKTDRIVARSRALRERNVWFCLHGVFSASYLGHRTGFDRWMKQQKIKRIYQGRNVVTVSDAVGRDLVEEFALRPAQLKTIYNPFDITALRAEAEADSERPDGDYLIHVGRFHPGKRHDRLLEAYAQSGIDAPLVLLGQGKPEQEQRLRQLAKTLHIDDRVWFKGFQKNPLPWIKGARMLVLSSDSEGFGNVVVEALLLHTPVASTRCPGGVTEILTGELARGLADLTSPALAQTMQSIYHNPLSHRRCRAGKIQRRIHLSAVPSAAAHLTPLVNQDRRFMSQTPLLSIVAAVYNGEKFLAQFFECIEQQQLDSYELILVNDGSTDNSLAVIAEWQERLQNVQVLEQENQGVSVARNTGLAAASGKYLAFPDIDDKLYPGMYRTLLEMAEKEHLDIATCNGTYVYEKRRESHPIFPLDRLPSTDVLPGHVWLKQALDSRKFLHVTWLNIYRHDFIRQHHFHFEPGLRHQDIPWTTEALLAAERVQYTSQQFYDYYIHSESVSHKPDNDDTLMRSARHYMKILEMLEAINQRYPDKVRHIAACRWQIAKEGLGIIHTFDSMKDESKKHVIINEFFDRGIWRLIWKNACTFRLRWRLGRRYLRIKRYRHAG